MKRREYLTGLAGVGALSATGQVGAQSDVRRLSLSSAVGDDTHHPGPPRFGQVGQKFYDMLRTEFVDFHAGGKDRDNFAPSIVGEPEQDPDNYDGEDFSWSLKEVPDDSDAVLEYAPPDSGVEQYDSGKHNVVEFAPDVPGRYVLELTDADGNAYEQLLHIFPENGDAGGPPRISIDGHYDSGNSEFVLESNPKLAPNSSMAQADLVVEWLADGRDALATEDIVVSDGTDSWTARIPKSALDGETARVHAAPWDTNAHGYTDTVVLDPQNEAIEYPNRPPEWIQNGIMYEIFPRSFMGPPEEGEWPTHNSNANFSSFQEKLDYLEELNVDVIWFTPTVPSESGNWKRQNYDQWDGSGNRFKYVGGGPHGYDALSYFDIAEDLTSEYAFSDYRTEPWPWEDGYDAENNVREAARESAMEEFQEFLEAAHQKDIKVCIDFVINHGGRHHPFFQDTISSLRDARPSGWTYKGIAEQNSSSKYFDWFARKDAPNETSDGTIVDPAPAATGFAGLRVMPQWNYGNVAVREHILAAAEHWAEMGVDAFRCDIAYGVPHSFWKEVREAVREHNSEFMMLDETIPNDPSFAENEFDMHFDTAGFMKGAGQGVINGGDPMALYDSIVERDREGWPEHTLIANSTENHDEQRLYKLARDGPRGDGAKAQRAVWAAGVVLPGVPFIYYGQERLITEYGHQRYDYDGEGNDQREGDVGPNNYKRAFMNWEENGDEVPQEHLQFYKDVTQLYKDEDILKPDADLQKTWFDSDDSVLVFGRSMETDDGRENVVVMVHFEPETAQVDLLPGTSTTDRLTGDDIGVDNESEGVTVEFDTLAVVETDMLFSVGDRIAQLDEGTGDDNGPGSYTYPTGDAYGDGVFDLSGFSIHTTADSVQFRAPIAGDLANPEGYADGITAQHLQVYLQNPEAEDGATEGRTGTNVTFESPYQYRVVADGENGARIEDYEGNVVAEGTVMANQVADELVVEMPKSSIEGGIRSYYVAPLMFGYDPDSEGNVMPVEAEAGSKAFGGAETPGMAPRVIDVVVPETASQSDALAYSADSKATIPYTSLASEFQIAGRANDPTGDDNGPGNFQYPSGPEGEVYEGMWDIDNVNIYESRSRVRFEYTMATEMQNVWGLNGISQQFPQVYLRDPEAGDDLPTSTEGRKGMNVSFAGPYHYRVVVHGEGTAQVENANGEVVSSDVNLVVDGKDIRFDFPMDAIGGSPRGMDIAALVAPYDGFGTGGVRQGFASSPGDYTIGTSGEPTGTAPHVMDMITPAGTSQAQALAYSENAKAQIPLASWDGVYKIQQGVGSISDPEDDDHGPGSYTYPKNLEKGQLDITNVDIESKAQEWQFTTTVGVQNNQFGNEAGFSTQLIQIYIQDPNAPDDAPTSTAGTAGTVSQFQEPYHYVAHIQAGSSRLENANGNAVVEELPASGDTENNTISFGIPKSPFNTEDISQMKVAIAVFSQDGFGENGIRQSFAPGEAGDWGFGGAKEGALDSAPRVVDLVGPDNVVDQENSLSYGQGSPPLIPLYTIETLVSGQAPGSGLTAIAAPGPTVFGGVEASLDASKSKDPDGQDLSFQWEQTAGPDVQEFNDTVAARPTFVAPDVDEEAELEFQVTVTDPDDNEATATTTATVIPQSENDAPTADAGEDQTVDPGETVSLQAVNSEDPNGGSLSYQWEQTAGPEVNLVGPDSIGAAFKAPEVEEDTDLVFELTVNDGQGKTATDSVTITVRGTGDGDGTTTTETETEEGDGFGPGFGVVSGALGTAGGVAYAAKSLLSSDEPAQPDDVAIEDVDDQE